MHEMMKGRTDVIHRARQSTIRRRDLILVHGRGVECGERGSHDLLRGGDTTSRMPRLHRRGGGGARSGAGS